MADVGGMRRAFGTPEDQTEDSTAAKRAKEIEEERKKDAESNSEGSSVKKTLLQKLKGMGPDSEPGPDAPKLDGESKAGEIGPERRIKVKVPKDQASMSSDDATDFRPAMDSVAAGPN